MSQSEEPASVDDSGQPTGQPGEFPMDKVSVVIPVLNEEQSLPLVLRDLPMHGTDSMSRVIVVDNGSTDGTANVARNEGATVVEEPQRGYGSACLRGLKFIEQSIEKGEAAPEVVVFVDGDYSDHPDMLPKLVAPIFAGEQDFVLGSRILGNREPGAMPPQSIYGNKLACGLMLLFFGGKFTDLGPFRAINYACLRDLKMVDTNFGWTIEMQIKAVRANLRYIEIPVPYRKRIGTSKISGTVSGTIRAGTKILSTIARYGLKK